MLTLRIRPCKYDRNWQGVIWLRADLPNQERSATEPVYGLICRKVERIETADKFAVVNQHPLVHVLGFEFRKHCLTVYATCSQ